MDLDALRDPIDDFAAVARTFCEWAERDRADEPRAVLQLLAELYAAALRLPQGEAPDDTIDGTTHEEWQRVYRRCASLPIDYYAEMFNPLEGIDAEPVMASLADDLADIHRDLRRGLHRYEQGLKEAAAWEWAFHFHAHWGHHATAAIYALHSWWSNYGEG